MSKHVLGNEVFISELTAIMVVSLAIQGEKKLVDANLQYIAPRKKARFHLKSTLSYTVTKCCTKLLIDSEILNNGSSGCFLNALCPVPSLFL